jgi:hypothetical protein
MQRSRHAAAGQLASCHLLLLLLGMHMTMMVITMTMRVGWW